MIGTTFSQIRETLWNKLKLSGTYGPLLFEPNLQAAPSINNSSEPSDDNDELTDDYTHEAWVCAACNLDMRSEPNVPQPWYTCSCQVLEALGASGREAPVSDKGHVQSRLNCTAWPRIWADDMIFPVEAQYIMG